MSCEISAVDCACQYLLGCSTAGHGDNSNFSDHDERSFVRQALNVAQVVDGHWETVLYAVLLKLTNRIANSLDEKYIKFNNYFFKLIYNSKS
jgi:hypothetical protein